MAILKIARMGHPVLSRHAQDVADVSALKLRYLIEDMIDTMADADGAGLAAPQVYQSLRLIVFHAPGPVDAPAQTTAPLTVLMNPEVEVLSDQTDSAWEGCLSLAGLRGLVERPNHILYRGLAPDGTRIERVARGFHARVVQHECDHLNGVLYPQRMKDLKNFIFETEAKYWQRPAP